MRFYGCHVNCVTLWIRQTQTRLLAGWRASRAIIPGQNNWLLFAALVEAALHRRTGELVAERVEPTQRRHKEW